MMQIVDYPPFDSHASSTVVAFNRHMISFRICPLTCYLWRLPDAFTNASNRIGKQMYYKIHQFFMHHFAVRFPVLSCSLIESGHLWRHAPNSDLLITQSVLLNDNTILTGPLHDVSNVAVLTPLRMWAKGSAEKGFDVMGVQHGDECW